MTTRIRCYTDKDRAAVTALGLRLTEGVAAWRSTESVAAAVSGWVVEALEMSDAEQSPVFVAEVDGAVVGFVCARAQRHWSGEQDGCVGELVVAESHESSGLAALLMTRAQSWAREHGFARLTVQTGAANTRALALYRRLGYRAEDVSMTLEL